MKRKVADFDDFINLCNISKENANNHDEKLPKAIQTNKWKLLVMMVNTKGAQAPSFDCALQRLYHNFQEIAQRLQVVIISTQHLVKMTPAQVVDSCASSDMYIILSHPHQAWQLDSRYAVQNVMELYSEFQRLHNCNGFPSGVNLRCPIWTQDKHDYISCVPDLFLPTLRIDLKEEPEDMEEYTDKIYKYVLICFKLLFTIILFRFFSEYNYDGEGVLVKFPFTTNQHYITCKSPEACMSRLKSESRRFYGAIPYCMVQPTLSNRMEYKVVCFNGNALYVASVGNSRKVSFNRRVFMEGAPTNKNALRFAFAENAIRELAIRCPRAILSGLVRVDIMFCSHLNRAVVNEFESLEAMYSTKKNSDVLKLENYLSNYWYFHLTTMLGKVMSG
jgi:hypothetical protein